VLKNFEQPGPAPPQELKLVGPPEAKPKKKLKPNVPLPSLFGEEAAN